MRWEIDLGGLDTQEALESHLAERGISVDDIWSVAADGVPRRKGDRIYLFGRATDGEPIVAVLAPAKEGWRPRTAWVMDDRERRWWRKHGGR